MVSTRSADNKKGGGTPAKGGGRGKAAASPATGGGKGKSAAATPPAKRGAAASAAAPAASPAPAAAKATKKPTPAATKKAQAAAAAWRLLVAGDFIVTALWVFVSCLFSHAASALIDLASEEDALLSLVSRGGALLAGEHGVVAAEQIARFATDEFVVTLAVLCLTIVAFGPLCAIFGGALFNPVHNVAFWVAGRHTAAVNLARAAAQVLGGVAGASAAIRLLPDYVSPSLPGALKPGVGLGLGCAVEFVLGAALNAVVLFAADTRSAAAAFAAPVLATVALGVAGAAYTGPILNPAQALAWYLQFGDAHPVEHHVLAFWAAPVAGAVAGGLLYRYAIAPLTGARKKPAARATRRTAAAAPAAATPARATRAAAAAKGKRA